MAENGDTEMISLDSDHEAKYRIGQQVHGLNTRVAVLEKLTGRHDEDLGEIKIMLAKLGMNLEHQAEKQVEVIANMGRVHEAQMEALKSSLSHEIKLQFAQHEQREKVQMAELTSGNEKIQRQILASIVGILLTVVGALAFFMLEKVQFVP